ncbi:hypothetical protein PYCCODRAFT_1427689 [Trametes coccinea BRFM310]|uniref:Restriction of telomere capping protein 4 n=1 Tax=Trametes coccinea (strain BRFM310) TaxID=1353009 RepID=A0A1Y2IC93_TRAC3|nr:hypothetical protein PYCCODRAFT_1427689 [Trametes coccinea BRFM310]
MSGQPVEARHPDPIVQPIEKCPVCPQRMGELRVHTGSSDAQHRGKLVQTCDDVQQCHYTVYHTPAYPMSDARHLLERIKARLINPNAYPTHFLPEGAVLRLAPPVLPTPTSLGPIECANPDCVTKSNKRTSGNRDCVGHFCKSCCIKDSDRARATHDLRLYCKTHKTPGYEGDVTAPQPGVGSVHHPIQSVPHVPAPTPSQSVDSEAAVNISSIARSAETATTAPAIAHTQASSSSVRVHSPNRPAGGNGASAASMVIPSRPDVAPLPGRPVSPAGPSTPRKNTGRSLARPLGPLWSDAARDADIKQAAEVTQKAETQQMEFESKRTVTFVIWYKDNTPPAYYPKFVPTHPKVRLRMVGQLTAHLHLTSESLIQWLQPHEARWSCGDIDSIIDIDSSNRLLLRIPPDPFTEWTCPKLEDEVQLLSRRALKRGGSSLVSPMKKIPRVMDMMSSVATMAPHDSMLSFSQLLRNAALEKSEVANTGTTSLAMAGSNLLPIPTTLPNSNPETGPVHIPKATIYPSVNHPASLPTLPQSSSALSPSTVSTSRGLIARTPSSEPFGHDDLPVSAEVLPKPGPLAPGPSVRKWPSEYYVQEIAQGFKAMKQLADCDTRKKQTQSQRFERVFVGVRFKRSTFNDNFRLWMNAPAQIQDMFQSYGRSDAGLWKRFVAALKDYSSGDEDEPQDAGQQLRHFAILTAPNHSRSDDSQTPPTSLSIATGTRSATPTGFPAPAVLQPGPTRYRSPPSLAPSEPVLMPSLWQPAPTSSRRTPQLEPYDSELEYVDAPPQARGRSLAPWPLEGLIPALPGARLCPYCDEDIDFEHSDTLKKMAEMVEAVSYPAPTLENPEHRAVRHWTDSFDYCEQHQFERDIQPLAQLRGWPDPIDFSLLWRRLHELRPQLKQIASSIESSHFYKEFKSITLKGKARRERILDDQTMGYYGGVGYHITHMILMHFFPVDIANRFSDLDYDSVLANVLLQEAAVLLIQADLQIVRAGAITTLDESRTYGRHRYPGNHNNDRDVHEVMVKIARIKKYPEALFTEYSATDSKLDFLDWFNERQLHSVSTGLNHTSESSTGRPPQIKMETNDVEECVDQRAEHYTFAVMVENDREILVLDD